MRCLIIRKNKTIHRDLFYLSITLSIVLIIIIIIIGIILYNYELQRAKADLYQANKINNTYISGLFQNIENSIMFLSRNCDIIDAYNKDESAVEKTLKIFRDYASINEDIACIYSAYLNGLFLINDYNPPPEFNIFERPWFISAIDSYDGISMGLPYQDAVSKKWMISTSKRIQNDKGKAIGVLAIDISLENLSHLLKNRINYKSSYSFIINDDGYIIIHHNEELIGKNIYDIRSDSKDIDYKEGREYYYYKGSRKIYIDSIIPNTGWIIVTAAETREIYRGIIYRMSIGFLVAIMMSIALLLIQNIYISTKFTKPIKHLEKTISGIINNESPDNSYYKYPDNEIGIIAENILKLTENELYKKNNELRTIMESTADGIIVMDNKGRLLYANKRFCSLWNISPDLIEEKDTYSIIYEVFYQLKYNKNHIKLIKEIHNSDATLNHFLYFRDKKIYEFYSCPIRNKEVISGRLYSFRDITDKKEAEERLKQNEKLFRTIFNLSPVGIVLSDLDTGRFLDMNMTFIKDSGYTKEALMSLTHWDITPQEYLELDHIILRSLKENGIFGPYEKEFIKEDKTHFSVLMNGIILLHPQYGEIALSIIQDVSERKGMETALRNSEEKLRTLFKSMTEIVVIHKMIYKDGKAYDFEVIDCNQAFLDSSNMPREKIIGLKGRDMYETGTSEYLDLYQEVAETQIPRKDERFFPEFQKHYLISIISPQKGYFATILTDITDRKRIEQIREEKNKELEQFLYITSHDLKSPIVNIEGFSKRIEKLNNKLQIFIEEKGYDDIREIINKEIPKSLNFIDLSIQKLNSMIEGLLTVSRTGREPLKAEKLNMKKTLSDIKNILKFELERINAELIIDDVNHNCYGDKKQINQLFSNIILNSIKYRDEKRKLIINIKSNIIEKKVIYAVSDTGTGIPKKFHKKIFEIFFRIASGADYASSGHGLGLSIVSKIIERHNGRIWLISKENEGTTFFIELFHKPYDNSHMENCKR